MYLNLMSIYSSFIYLKIRVALILHSMLLVISGRFILSKFLLIITYSGGVFLVFRSSSALKNLSFPIFVIPITRSGISFRNYSMWLQRPKVTVVLSKSRTVYSIESLAGSWSAFLRKSLTNMRMLFKYLSSSSSFSP